MSMEYKNALIIGGSSGIGRELALNLAELGVRTVVVGRDTNRLADLKANDARIETISIDAAGNESAQQLLSDIEPDLLVLVGGQNPKMTPVHEMNWDEFSETWNNDTKLAFEFTKAALNLPLASGSTIVSFSSGAALGGSPLSGGYAGAKRMQHFLVNYGQREANRLGLNLRFLCIIPKQLIAGTQIGTQASAAYAEAAGINAKKFMDQWEAPLTAKVASSYLVDLLARKPESDVNAYTITGTSLEAME
ncbi:MAG: SDR family oxidoreductase [Sneathiella sp.]